MWKNQQTFLIKHHYWQWCRWSVRSGTSFFPITTPLLCLLRMLGCYHWSSVSAHTVKSTGGFHCLHTSRGAKEQANRNRMRSDNTGKLGNESCKNTTTLTFDLGSQTLSLGLICFQGKESGRKEMKSKKDCEKERSGRTKMKDKRRERKEKIRKFEKRNKWKEENRNVLWRKEMAGNESRSW